MHSLIARIRGLFEAKTCTQCDEKVWKRGRDTCRYHDPEIGAGDLE